MLLSSMATTLDLPPKSDADEMMIENSESYDVTAQRQVRGLARVGG